MTTSIELESKLFKGFADQSRLAILTALVDGPTQVSSIVSTTKLTQPNVSTHLACLLECGLVQKEKKGRAVFYALAMPEIGAMLKLASKTVQKRAKTIYECTNY